MPPRFSPIGLGRKDHAMPTNRDSWQLLAILARSSPIPTEDHSKFPTSCCRIYLVNGKPMGSEMASMAVDLQENLLCDVCSNAGRGVKFPGKQICLECAGDDAELVKEIGDAGDGAEARRDDQRSGHQVTAANSPVCSILPVGPSQPPR